MSAGRGEAVRTAFAAQARSCRDLGSELTARIVETLGTALQPGQGAVARRVLDWPGDPSSRGASVPLRLAGAIHAQVLQDRAPALAAAYAQGEAPAALLLETIAGQEADILTWLDRAPQTNEVGRAAALIAGARFALAQLDHPLPLALRELGASAGLNLNFPDYSIDFNGKVDSSALFTPDWRGALPPDIPLAAPDRRGVDLAPVDRGDPIRLRAYVWPDQPRRLARLDAALAHARTHPVLVDQGDAADWLEGTALANPGLLTLVYHTIAHQYFPPETQSRIARHMAATGAAATTETPLARLGMEADSIPGGAALVLDLWDGRHRRWHLGRADFHGRWIDWSPRPA
ncbi:DUF2332 family protein [Paracoccus sp. S1E-3]|uniref:DUF2332 domain-containing protein n=1 Tax=Paracoccus sp. S1E-3 TaxID=2756130 RepID=UPI0015EFB181|nr:DUF2332 family protein [Paracoccus sp. S1E-3]MBA4489582.1 DUF2332 family protein [Paracoccus sp. S1E-3]